MTPENFVFWLQGFAELNGDAPPTKEQWDSIREHLALQFNKVTLPVEVVDNRLAPSTIQGIINKQTMPLTQGPLNAFC